MDFKAIVDFINERIPASKAASFNNETSLFRERLLDSISLTELVVLIEAEWNIKVEPYELVYENFDTVANLKNYLEAKISET